MSGEKSLVIPLNVGLNDSAIDEALGVGSVRSSKNTRFTVNRGVVRKAPALQTFSTAGLDGEAVNAGASLIPIAGGRASPLALSPSPPLYVQDDGLKVLRGATNTNQERQNAFYPMQVVAAGAVGVQNVWQETVNYITSILNGPNLWVLTQGSYDDRAASDAGNVENEDGSTGAANYGLYIVVLEAATGRVLCPSTRVLDNTALAAFVSASGSAGPYLTCHDDEAKCVLWWGVSDIGTGISKIWASPLTLAAGNVTRGTDVTIYTTDQLPRFVVSSEGKYGEGFAADAWVFVRKNGSSTNMVILRVDVTTLTPHTLNTITLTNEPTYLAIAAQTLATSVGFIYLVSWAASSPGSPPSCLGQTFYWDGTTLASLYSPAVVGPLVECPITVTHYHHFVGEPATLFASSPLTLTGGLIGDTGSYPRTRIVAISLVNFPGNALVDANADWCVLYGQARSYRTRPDTDLKYSYLRPLVAVVRQYNGVKISTDPLYVSDQAGALLTVAAANSDYNQNRTPISVIARFGVDLVESKPRWSPLLAVCGQSVCMGYHVDPAFEPARTFGQNYRYMLLDSLKRAVTAAYDETGVAMISGALLTYWDGFELAELCPLYKPVLSVETTNGDVGLSGVYSFSAVYTWVDGQDQVHRSAPSTPVVIDLTGKSPGPIQVTLPLSLKNGVTQRALRVELFCKAPGAAGSSLMASSTARLNVDTTDDGVATFSTGVGTAINTIGRLLYTDDGDLIPGCAPPSWHIAVIGQRTWIISAERRGQAYYSKLKQLGIAYEFPPELNLLFPSSAGALQATIEVDGNPLFLADNGVYAVFGPGPNNAGGGVEFSDPRRVSDIGCVHRDSVVRTPVGTLYVSRDCFAIVRSGGQVDRLIEAKPSTLGNIVGTALFQDTQEALFFGDGTGTRRCLVYNYEANRWSEWTHFDGETVFHAVWSPDDRVAVISHGEAQISRLDPLGEPATDSATHVKIESGWLQPMGPQDACQIRELILQGYYDKGSHGLRVEAFLDYSETAEQTCTFEWTSDELDECVVNDRYTLKMDLGAQPARAVLFRFTELDGTVKDEAVQRGAFNPLYAELTFGPAEGVQRTFLPAAMK